jgi:hypothetical protein
MPWAELQSEPRRFVQAISGTGLAKKGLPSYALNPTAQLRAAREAGLEQAGAEGAALLLPVAIGALFNKLQSRSAAAFR